MALDTFVSIGGGNLPHVEMARVDAAVNGDQFDFQPAQENRVSYRNTLDVPVWVAERSGAVQMMNPLPGRERVFGVRISRKFHNNTSVSYRLDEIVESRVGALRPGPGKQAMAESYSPCFGSMHSIGASKDIVLTLDKRTLEDYGGVVYNEECDIVVSLTAEKAIHPGSPQARLARLKSGVEQDCGLNLVEHSRISVAIIDNESVFGDKFINLGGVVHRVVATKSNHYASGIYVSRSGIVNEVGQASKPTVTHYKFEEASDCMIKLFDSAKAAKSMGDFEKAAEQQTAQLKSETVVLKGQLEKETLESKLKAQKTSDEHEERSLRRKDYYEDRSYSRKDDSEHMKYVFAAIAGFFGLLAVILR